VADQTWQGPGATGIGHQADLAERLNEGGGAGSQYDVAGEGDVGTGTGGHAIDGADNRHFQTLQGTDQRVVILFNGLAQIRHLGIGVHIAIAQVLTGAETAAVTGNQQAAYAVIFLDLLQRIANFAMHLSVETVHPIGTVQGQYRNPFGNFKFDGFVCHGDYFPVKFGLRFSMNAAMPSLRSSVAASRVNALRSRLRPLSKVVSYALSRTSLA
jgi:hypothetical protein